MKKQKLFRALFSLGAIPYIDIESVARFGMSDLPPIGNGAFCNLSSDSLEECVLPFIRGGNSLCQDQHSNYGVVCRSKKNTTHSNFIIINILIWFCSGFLAEAECGDDCLDLGICSEGQFRLVTQSAEHEGILQTCFGGEWWTVCTSQFGDAEASVVCSQLGFPRFPGIF